MTICSLQSVDGIPFGAARSALAVLGSPLREGLNRLGEEELVFAKAIYRFVGGKLVEVSFQPPAVIEIDGHHIAASSLVEFLQQQDTWFRLKYGFAVAPGLGLAVDVDHDNGWITAFVAGRWDGIK